MQEKVLVRFPENGEGEANNVVEEIKKQHITNLQQGQISLEFGSFSSNLTPSQQAEIEKWLGKRAVKNRVYFIRHGKSKEDKGTQNIQSSAAELTDEAKKQFNQIAKDLKNIGLNSENTYMMYHDGTEKEPMVRIIESANIIKDNLELPSVRVSASVRGLDTTDKDDLVQSSRFVATAQDVNEFCREISLKMGNGELDPATSDGARMGNVNVVCVIHKSNIGAIRSYFFKEENKPVDLGHGGYQNGEIQEVDFIGDMKKLRKDGLEGADVLNYNVDKTILNLNSSNLNGWLAYTLMKEEELKGYLKQFRAGKLQIFELQNLVNVYFMKNEGLFEKYMLSDSYDMRVFCVANLVANGEWEMGSFDYAQDKSGKLKKLLEIESETSLIRLVDDLFRIFDDEQKKSFIDELVVCSEVGSWLQDKVKKEKLAYYMHYQNKATKRIFEIRQKTLDERIKRGEDVVIPLGFEGEKYESMDELLKGDGITIIEGEAGAGKSTKLLEILEYLKPSDNNNLYPVYVSFGGKNLEEIKESIEEQTKPLIGTGQYKFVYLFDALDEAFYSNDELKEFSIYVSDQLDSRVVITSRPGICEKGLWEILCLKKFDEKQVELYINDKLLECQRQEQINIWTDWRKNNFIKGIENNPLMLSILVDLLVSGEDVVGISNRVDLYYKIVNKRLMDWEEKRSNSQVQAERIPYRKKLLSIIAKETIHTSKTKNILNLLNPIRTDISINTEFIENLIVSNEILSLIMPKDKQGHYNLECLNMLFKQDIDGNYDFVHESFREYFLFLYLKEELKKENLDYLLIASMFKVIDLSFLKVYFDSVEKIDEQNTLLSVVLNIGFIFSPSYRKIFYLLCQIDMKDVFTYLERVSNNELNKITVAPKSIPENMGIGLDLGPAYFADLVKSSKIGGYPSNFLTITHNKSGYSALFSDYSLSAVDILSDVFIILSTEKQREFVEFFINHDNIYAKGIIISVLGKAKGYDYLDLVESFKSHKDANVLVSLIGALWELKGKESFEILKSFRNSSEKEVLVKLVDIMGKIRSEDSIKVLRDFRSSDDSDVLIAMVNVLVDIGGKENLALVRSLASNQNKLFLSEYIRVLSKLGTKEDLNIIRRFKTFECLSDEDYYFMENYIEVLMALGEDQDIEIIKSYAYLDNPYIQMNIIKALGEVGGEENLKIIRGYKDSDEKCVLTSIKDALKKQDLDEDKNLIEEINSRLSSKEFANSNFMKKVGINPKNFKPIDTSKGKEDTIGGMKVVMHNIEGSFPNLFGKKKKNS